MIESEAIRARHAVRNYTTKLSSPTVIDGLKGETDQRNRLGQPHIQLVTENGEALKSMIPLFGRFKKVKNYIALAARKQDGFYAEYGYYGARFTAKAQQAGLDSCRVTNTHNAKRCPVSLEPHEELAGVIVIGYGTTDGTQHKSKSMEKLCKSCSDRWFIDGMNATALASTGLNKQNFLTEASGNTVSIHPKDNRPMSQIDTGIVKYHFEAGAGRENFVWKRLEIYICRLS